jgi:uncharacterized repeat protein (TIGR01451 family)/CSLREA domain-containing protein
MRTRSTRPRPRTRSAFRRYGLESLEDRRLLATITVNTTADENNQTDATLSLREAIEVSNGTLAVSSLSPQEKLQVSGALSSPNTIAFDIPGSGVQTISPATDLPAITASVIIDGYTQPGAKANTNPIDQADNAVLLIDLSGSSQLLDQLLSITASGVTVRGLILNASRNTLGVGIGVDVSGTGATIAGDFIGTDATGETPVANTAGIQLETGASGVTIGGTAPAARNIIAGNFADILSNSGASGVSNLDILGNFVGLDAAGTKSLDVNTASPRGIELDGAGSGLTIGGTAAGSRNVIDAAVDLVHQTGAVVQGNYFDTDLTGTKRVAAPETGLFIESDQGVTIGGPAAGAGNVVATGISVPGGRFTAVTGLVIQGNSIGTDATGTIDLGTSDVPGGLGLGIYTAAATGTLIGGTGPGEGNKIAFINGSAMSLQYPVGTQILGNSVYSNTGAGLALTDQDGNAIPASVLVQLTSANPTSIAGTFQGSPNTTYRIEFFASPVQPAGSPFAASQRQQGKTFLGFEDKMTDALGHVAFTFSPSTPIAGDQYVTATATPTAGPGTTNGFTVGYSNGLLISGPVTAPDLALSGTAPSSVTLGNNVTYTLTVTNDGTAAATGVTLTDTLPAGVKFVSATGGVTPGEGVLTFNLGNLAAHATAPTVTIIVTPTAAGTLHNTASVAGNEPDPTPGDNSLSRNTAVNAAVIIADLSLQGTAPGSVTLGQNVTYTLTVANAGPSGATGVKLIDTLPAGVHFISATGGMTPVNGVLTFHLGSLAADAPSPKVTIVVTPTAAGTLQNTATVSANQTDPTLNDNARALNTVVVPPVTESDGPTVQSLQRFGFHFQPTILVLTFNEPLDRARAEFTGNYRIVGPAGGYIPVDAAVYDVATRSVTLYPAQRLNVHYPYQLTVVGTGPHGLTDTSGRSLDGARTGRPGSNYHATVDWSVLVLTGFHPLGPVTQGFLRSTRIE